MAFQQGIEDLGNGVSTFSKVFPTQLAGTPDLVMVSVENVVDGSPLYIHAIVTAKSSTGFTVKLSAATNSANYKLTWFAGQSSTIATTGIKVSDTVLQSGVPEGGDYIPFVSESGVPMLKRVTWDTLITAFGVFVSTPPTAPSTTGALGYWSVDDAYFYSHDGVKWGRSNRVTESWELGAPVEFVQEGSVDLTQASTSVTVEFEDPFGLPPFVNFEFENVYPETKSVLSGIITHRSKTNFTVKFNTPPNSSHYTMHWVATGELPI